MSKRFFAVVKLTAALLCNVLLCYGSFAQTVTNTLLVVDYETGTPTSGVGGLNANGTDATASDAAYMVQPGATGNWAIAHKVVDGDPGYYSDGNYRSEADALNYLPGRYLPGDERRYEFSVLLKDWVPFNGTDITETNIFQVKMSNSLPIPVMIRTKRNNIEARYGNTDGSTTVVTILSDLRPYVNQWMHFRIDVKFTMDNTGYARVYLQLPGATGYTQVDEQLNRRTFTGDPAAGNIGYNKWGIYVAPQGVTRIAYHDDIRIYELNNASASRAAVWNNPIDNPSGLSTVPFTAPLTTGNNTLYAVSNEGSNTPSFFYNNAAVSGLAASTQSGRVLLNGWTLRAVASGAPPTPLNLNQYYEFKMDISKGSIRFDSLVFTARRGNAADPGTYVLRSSLDGFATNIGSEGSFPTGATAATRLVYPMASLNAPQGQITFRMYWYGSNRTGGSSLVGIDEFSFYGAATTPMVLPVSFNEVKASSGNGLVYVNWTTLTKSHNSHFEVQASINGKDFTTVKTVQSRNGNATSLQQYEATIDLNATHSLLTLAFLLPFIGFGRKIRFRKSAFMLLLLIAGSYAMSCRKSFETDNSRTGETLYIRIKQVDKDGAASYSKVVSVKTR